MERKIYFYNIDFIRFVCAVFIVFFHIFQRFDEFSPFLQNCHCDNMRYCVEIFFIIAGFMLVYTFNPQISTFNFFMKKVARLLPVIVFTVVVCFILSFFKVLHFQFMENMFTLFFLNGMRIASTHTNAGNLFPTWFVSVLVWVSLLYFYIIKNFGYKTLNVLLWIIVFSGLYCLEFQIQFFLFDKVLSGLVAIGVGILLGQIFMRYKNEIAYIYRMPAKVFFTLLEGGVLGQLLYVLITTKSHLGRTDVIFWFSLLFILFILKFGYLSKLLDNNISKMLGQYSYSIFVTHAIWIHIFKKYWYINDICEFLVSWQGVFLSVLICILFGIAVYYLVEKTSTKYFKRKFNL